MAPLETLHEIEITKYENVKDQTTEDYFLGNQFSIDAFNKKYTAVEGETYVQALKRVCDYMASCEETEELQTYWSERWFDEIYNDWWHPAGSIMQGAAAGKKISMANCTTISMGTNRDDEEWDNLEGIVRNTAYNVAKCAAYRQGLGVDFSRLRPSKTKVMNSSNESSGSTHWMKFIDSIGYYVGQKGRIPAMLFSLRVDHPDIVDFIKLKSDYTKVQNANISVQCTDAFYKAVENDEEWELKFEIPEVKKGDRVYLHVHSTDCDCHYDAEKNRYYYIARQDRPYEKMSQKVNARELLELISKCMFNHAEPGIQNIDVARYWSNSDYVYDPLDPYDSRIVSTNACSEQYLSLESLCVLASINAGRFSKTLEKLRKQLKKIAYSINRFLDNVNEMELRSGTYATPLQKMAIEKLRRTGAGITNLGGWLFKKNLEYGSKDGNKAIEEFTDIYNYYLYDSSINLGREKGSFGLFDREKLEKSPFIKKMMKKGLEFDALRNITVSSIAPTGTLTLMFRDLCMGYGVEPSFGMYFWKRTRMSGKYEYYFCVPNIVRQVYKQAGYEIPIDSDTIRDTWDGERGQPVADFIEKHKKDVGVKFKSATEVSALDKLDLMAGMMKSVDSSISVTYMLPEDTEWKDVYDFILLAHKKGVKSIAAFPDKKMCGIVTQMSFKDLAKKLTEENVTIHKQNFSDDEWREVEKWIAKNNVESSHKKVEKITSERPKTVPCDVHHIRVRHKQGEHFINDEYFVLVGLDESEKPYEVFCGSNGHIPKEIKKGTITRVKNGNYKAEFDNGLVIEDITKYITETEEGHTRLTSLLLRSGADVHLIVQQLEKVTGDMQSFSRSMARALKKYIPNGTKEHGVTCTSCGGDLFRIEGCVLCTSCGNSKCS